MYIVVDIGGTNTRIAGTRELETITDPIIFDTPQNYQEGINVIAAQARSLAGEESIDRMVVGIPATLSQDKRVIIGAATNIPDWSGKKIADDLEKVMETHVVLDNDAALVGLGEAHYGAGQGAELLVYITVSTGVNGVRVVGGQIDVSAHSFSIGHQYLSMENHAPTWDKLISGRSIHDRFGMAPRELGKDHPVWEELARVVAFGLHNSIVHWAPHRVVLGGSMFNEIGIPIERVRFHLKEITKVTSEITEIVHSQLGDVGGLWGGMARLKQERM